MRKLCWLSGLIVWLSLAGVARATLTIYYLRHAEGGHNVTRKYAESVIPTNQWPAYVGNPNMFTTDGEAQVRGVATNLLAYKFDFIAVSPLWRTRHTILPYLKTTGRTAEVWPELTETRHFDISPAPVAPQFVSGKHALKLPADEQSVFKLRPDRGGCCDLTATNLAEAVGLAKQTLDLLRSRFGTNNVTVLLVGHGTAGETLIRYLTRNPSWCGGAQNATLWMAQEQPDGVFGYGYPVQIYCRRDRAILSFDDNC